MSIQKFSIQGMLKKDEGFTLVELLIVIAIIAILAAIAIPQFSKYRENAYEAEIKSAAKNAYTASQAYLSDQVAGTACCTTAQLLAGGLPLTSGNVTVEATVGTMTVAGVGGFGLETSALPAGHAFKTATVCGDGSVNFAAAVALAGCP